MIITIFASLIKKMMTNHLRLPAEWEPQSGVQLTWPHAETDWRPYLDEITETYLQLAEAIARRELLLIIAPDTDAVRTLLQSRLDAACMANIRLCRCQTNDTWARDHGGITLVGNDGAQILDFRFNGWGEKFAYTLDNAITRQLCEQNLLQGQRIDHDDLVLEGGSIESDGMGTVFTTSACLLADHRNQPLTQAQLTTELQQRLHAERIVWIDHGTLTGDDTDGHIDTTVRLAPDDTLLYTQCEDETDEHFADFHAMECQLQTFTTPSGKPYRLIPLPLPDAVWYDGERLPATYANFLVINGAVIYPTYHQPTKDLLARDAIARAFPDREIIGINSRVIVRQHGSIHCLTMQYPQGVLR